MKITCPLGATCVTTDTTGVVLEKCQWFIELDGQNPITGEVKKEQGCSMAWLPVLLVENARRTGAVQEATEGFRNEMVEANNISNLLALKYNKG